MDIEIREIGFDAPVVSVADNSFALAAHYGKGNFKCSSGKGFSFWNNHYRFAADTVLQARADIPVLELHITRSGSWSGHWDGMDELLLQPGQFNLTYTPHVKTSAFFKKSMDYNSCDIHFEKSYLEELAADFPALDIFLQAVTYNNNAVSLAPVNHYCSKEMMTAVDAILDNPFGPKTQPYILEIKVREILLCALEKCAVSSPAFVLTAGHEEALRYAREKIKQNGEHPLSLTELSKAAGINEYLLKKGFRHLFGVSPYEYHVELKMHKAKNLLLSSSEPISTIGYTLGYSMPSSFTREFKKATGVSPVFFRKMGGKA